MSMSGHRNIDCKGCVLPLPTDSYIAGALQLACDLAAVCGPKHWAWKLGMLFSIDLDLSYPKFCGKSSGRGTDEYREFIVLGILDLWDWLASLDISQDPSYFLHTRAVKALALCGDMIHSVSCKELKRRVESYTPSADCLGDRFFIPQSLMRAA